MNQTGDWYATTAPENKYQYNGKELNEELGLNWNDYGARCYDPAIARWNAVDILAESFANWSAYHYVYGNPISYNDPTGMAGNLRDGITVIFRKDGNISDEAYANFTMNYILNVMSVWGDKGTGGKITFKFALDNFDGNLEENENLVNVGNYGDKPSRVKGDNQEIAYMNINSEGANTAAHEFGHHMGLVDRYLEGFRWNYSSGITGRETTPIGSNEISDPNYDPNDNLYSNMTTTLTPEQIRIVNSREVEESQQNNRGVAIRTKGSDPNPQKDIRTPYSVSGNRVKGLRGFGKGTRRKFKKYILDNKRY